MTKAVDSNVVIERLGPNQGLLMLLVVVIVCVCVCVSVCVCVYVNYSLILHNALFFFLSFSLAFRLSDRVADAQQREGGHWDGS